MCRMLAVKSTKPRLMDKFVTLSEHSLDKQAEKSLLIRSNVRNQIHVDGCGLAWYSDKKNTSAVTDSSEESDEEELASNIPSKFVSVAPAWTDMNIKNLVKTIASPLFFAHVRSSTGTSTSLLNCHPWTYGSITFMHNGGISMWPLGRRELEKDLDDELFYLRKGNTDSETIFVLYLQELKKLYDIRSVTIPQKYMVEAMVKTLALLKKVLGNRDCPKQRSMLNLCITDGTTMIASRYSDIVSDPSLPSSCASLCFSTGSDFVQKTDSSGSNSGDDLGEIEEGVYRMEKSRERNDIVIVASEPLTFERSDWVEVPIQTIVVVTAKNNVLLLPAEGECKEEGEKVLPARDAQKEEN